jgi:hypothetical protein
VSNIGRYYTKYLFQELPNIKMVPFLSNASTLGVQAQDSPDLFMGVEQNVKLLRKKEPFYPRSNRTLESAMR